jgi:hypothetical protein
VTICERWLAPARLGRRPFRRIQKRSGPAQSARYTQRFRCDRPQRCSSKRRWSGRVSRLGARDPQCTTFPGGQGGPLTAAACPQAKHGAKMLLSATKLVMLSEAYPNLGMGYVRRRELNPGELLKVASPLQQRGRVPRRFATALRHRAAPQVGEGADRSAAVLSVLTHPPETCKLRNYELSDVSPALRTRLAQWGSAARRPQRLLVLVNPTSGASLALPPRPPARPPVAAEPPRDARRMTRPPARPQGTSAARRCGRKPKASSLSPASRRVPRRRAPVQAPGRTGRGERRSATRAAHSAIRSFLRGAGCMRARRPGAERGSGAAGDGSGDAAARPRLRSAPTPPRPARRRPPPARGAPRGAPAPHRRVLPRQTALRADLSQLDGVVVVGGDGPRRLRLTTFDQSPPSLCEPRARAGTVNEVASGLLANRHGAPGDGARTPLGVIPAGTDGGAPAAAPARRLTRARARVRAHAQPTTSSKPHPTP